MRKSRSLFCDAVGRSGLIWFDYSEKVTDSTPVPPPDWEALVSLVADEILAERSPARLLQVRARLYDLLTHCIPPTTIIKVSGFTLEHRDGTMLTFLDSNLQARGQG